MIGDLLRVPAADGLAPGAMICVEVGVRYILFANVNGKLYATDDTCTHEDASLATGALQGDLVKCPLHGSRFCLRTGEPMEEPADESLRCYPVLMRDGEVFVSLAAAAD